MVDKRQRHAPGAIEPDEAQKRTANQEGVPGEPADKDAAAPRPDDGRRPVGSSGGGAYGAESEDD